MSNSDLENFPTSESAKRMLESISEDFYKDSYVMKWLQQVMGLEWDDTKKIIEEELPKQFFPETATWGLFYHELKWQLPVRENLSYEERRKLIYQKRDFKGSMTPYKMEEYLQKVIEAEVHIMDCHDPGEYGFVPGHPNIFKVVFLTENTLDSKKARKELNRIKQSHTVLLVINHRIENKVDNTALEKIDVKRVEMRMSFPFFEVYLLDGSKLLDGSGLLNSKRRYNFIIGLKYQGTFSAKESIENGTVISKENKVDNTVLKKIDVKRMEMRTSFPFFEIYLLNGSKLLIGLKYQGTFSAKESIENGTVISKRNLCFLDGSSNLDGSKILNSIYQKEEI